jgi:hypothetical protein
MVSVSLRTRQSWNKDDIRKLRNEKRYQNSSFFSKHYSFDLLSYALVAEDSKTAPQGRVPQNEGKDKQHIGR